MSHITLLRIPAELLCHILAFLSDATYDLVRVREVSKRLEMYSLSDCLITFSVGPL